MAYPHYVQGALNHMPQGIYGISYDIFTNPTERDLPDGWNSPRRRTYRRIIRYLSQRQYIAHQYSDRRNDNTAALAAYQVMVGLRNALAPDKLATTLKSLKMYHMDPLQVMDQTHELLLGGFFCQLLTGPVPRNLIPPGVFQILPVVPHPAFLPFQ